MKSDQGLGLFCLEAGTPPVKGVALALGGELSLTGGRGMQPERKCPPGTGEGHPELLRGRWQQLIGSTGMGIRVAISPWSILAFLAVCFCSVLVPC